METQTKLRIYVGGLGEAVTEEDLRSTFSKSGSVEAVEFVRTKGRSFAYIDFLPSSEKSVAKLFSTYNGCAWKGGKLRLEKAKLHYLERLKREWAEDADLASETHDDDVNSMASAVGQEEALDDSAMIHMFIPRLRKVKSLPYKGTGKHKYSFQHVEASTLPVHFCDCVEHAGSINTIKETQIHHASVKDGGMNQDEINMMNSVLNKFLEREPHAAASRISSRVASQAEVVPSDHNGDSTDDDNIIINAVAGPNDVTHLLQSMKKQTGSNTKMARLQKLRNAAFVKPQNNVRIQKGKGKNSLNWGKMVQGQESDKEVKFSIPKRKQTGINQSEQQPESLSTEEESDRKQSTGNTSLSPSMKPGVLNNEAQPQSSAADLPNGDSNVASFSNHEKVDPESHPPQQMNEDTETDPKNIASDKPARGTSSSQKSSWMQLVSSANNTPFSLSQILPETQASKKSTQAPSGQRTGTIGSINFPLKRKREHTSEGLDLGKGKSPATASVDIDLQGLGRKKQKSDIQQSAAPDSSLLAKATDSNESVHPSTSGIKSDSEEKNTTSDTCLFMRSDSSMKDWVKARRALSSSLKKKK